MTTWTRTPGPKRCGHYSGRVDDGASKLLSPRRSQPAQYVWMFVKLIAAFSPIWAILAVLMSAWTKKPEAEAVEEGGLYVRQPRVGGTIEGPDTSAQAQQATVTGMGLGDGHGRLRSRFIAG